MKAAGLCIDVEIKTSECLGQRWPTPNIWEVGEREEDCSYENLVGTLVVVKIFGILYL